MSEKKQQSFRIGQIVYVLSEKAEAIVPAIVVEEMVVKKLDGSSVSWKVAVGPPDKKKIVASHDISGDVFMSLDEIKEVMTKRLAAYVDNLIGEARQRTESWYGKRVEQPEQKESSNGKIDPASLIDSIEGREKAEQFKRESHPAQDVNPDVGKSYRVKVPTSQSPLQSQMPVDPSDPKSVLRAKLRSLAEPEEQEVDENYEGEFVITDDGRKIPVKFNQN